MRQRLLSYGLLAAVLAIGLVPPVYANSTAPVYKDDVFTVESIDAKSHTATLEGTDGQTFQTYASSFMQSGKKVKCDLVEEAVVEPQVQVQNCEPWKR